MIPLFPDRAKEFAFIYADGWFHIFYMRHDLLLSDDSTEVELGHAVSQNLAQWEELDPVLHVRPDHWDDLHIWSPTIIQQDSTWYMYYTGVTSVPGFNDDYQRIGVATSTDLVNWTRYDEPVFEGNQVPWAFADSSQDIGCQFRDPCAIPDPNVPGQWLMYYATIPRAGIPQQIVGVGFNQTGLSPWQDLMPLWNTDATHFLGFIESPLVFSHDGRWYLFFTTNSGHTIRYQYADSPTADSTHWVGTYRLFDDDSTTDSWFGPEFLEVGGHEYFAAVNSANRGIEIREMMWSDAAHFSLETPAIVTVPAAPGSGPGPSIISLGEEGRALKFRVTLPRMMNVKIGVFDLAGRKIRALSDGTLAGGATLVSWDERNSGGQEAATGVYFVRLQTPLGSHSAKARVLR